MTVSFTARHEINDAIIHDKNKLKLPLFDKMKFIAKYEMFFVQHGTTFKIMKKKMKQQVTIIDSCFKLTMALTNTQYKRK